MPELPEVETMARKFRRKVCGRTIQSFSATWPRQIVPEVDRVRRALKGRTILRLSRRGKYLVFHLDDGSYMLVHLGNIQPGDTVLVHHAAGGVGTAVAQIARAYEAGTIFGVASSPKKEFVEAQGMRFIDRRKEDFVEVVKIGAEDLMLLQHQGYKYLAW